MEVIITSPDAFPDADPLTRLLAAILEWLRALLAAHQEGLRPPAPIRRIHARETPVICINPAPTAETRAPRAPVPAWDRARVLRPSDMSAGIPRPRPVAPH